MKKIVFLLIFCVSHALCGEITEDYTSGEEYQFAAMARWVGSKSAELSYKELQKGNDVALEDILDEATNLWLEHIVGYFETQRSLEKFLSTMLEMIYHPVYIDYKKQMVSEGFLLWCEKNAKDLQSLKILEKKLYEWNHLKRHLT